MTRRDEYRAFVAAKAQVSPSFGAPVEASAVHPRLKPHQRDLVRWAVRGGRRALFAKFGLGKSTMQMETVRLSLLQVGGRGFIVAPLGVRSDFRKDAAALDIDLVFVRTDAEVLAYDTVAATRPRIFLTNFESVRESKLSPDLFSVASLDEASVLRGFGGTKTFREFMRLFANVPRRFVATATPDPNEYVELLAYAAYLDVMDVGQAKTRFFKRNSEKADQLTIHPHKEEEFWLWVASWAVFLEKPSDLGYSDDGYELPELDVRFHEIAVDHAAAAPETSGQHPMFREASHGLVEAAREKRDTIQQRVAKMTELLADRPGEHCLIWHDLESERKAIESAAPDVVTVYGAQDIDEREEYIEGFAEGRIARLGGKPCMVGSGPNFQHHCAWEIFLGIGYKFNDFIQALHRTYRFLQSRPVRVDIIHAESERAVLRNLLAKWERHKEQAKRMSDIIRKYGLAELALAQELQRSMGVERVEVTTEHSRLVNEDTVEETMAMPANSVGLVLTSIPFSTQYEYTPSYNDFGHTDSNEHFFRQMDFLTPELLRVLQPGRLAAIHVKDRVVPGGLMKLGFQTVYPFHARCIEHYTRHGFAYMGMKTIVTDVVRENNQTYRLGYTEQCKDGSKMSFGMPEYLLLFRKPPTDNSRSYADSPVVKHKTRYSLAKWQVDAHGFTRSSGDRLMQPEEYLALSHDAIFKIFTRYGLEEVYDFDHHVAIGDRLKTHGMLPSDFMLLQPPSWHPDVWTDITRMLTLNGAQSAKGKEMHLCPMQFDIADRAIEQWSNEGDVVFDPFGGLMTVPYRAVLKGRIGWGNELNPGYFLDGCKYVAAAEQKKAMPTLFDTVMASSEMCATAHQIDGVR